ncbi:MULTISPECIES: sugar-binding domain-containing protein [unclassified Leifsonia]|uniref:glycoside hydrolase family 2 protein n=1 Tax=unclassified Leifsonia TaxID=2663824 RepID=UPI0008A812EE|nr:MULTISPECIES: sugar-binding domain-containing protein [unclassified Leifsonia]SEI10970.1 Glycosyl hydrolases family 2, TIM barrel domain [Leifsonia sp. CL154]SFL89851.1 Glycosyl hydrolases family 2, TIM barrel domain [Leifsonia sp. CL147]
MLTSENPVDPATAQDGCYPRPQLVRAGWHDLSGEWTFAFDDDDRGGQEHWETAGGLNGTIQVPFPFESEASGVRDTGFHPVVWYQRVVLRDELPAGERLILHFGAVDHSCEVWVDGRSAGRHEGGSTPFSLDITDLAGEGDFSITVRAEDDPADVAQPRGKQDWRRHPHSIWYHRTTGIWQPVWLEAAAAVRLEQLHWLTDVPAGEVTAQLRLSRPAPEGTTVLIEVSHGDELLARTETTVWGREAEVPFRIHRQSNGQAYEELLWSPAHPTLLDATVRLRVPGAPGDAVSSYFGLRSTTVEGGRFLLNDRPVYLRSVLNQGYWPGTHSAAPSTDALRAEAQLILDLGFNATRLHQKYEDPRFLFWADTLGLLVWGEAPAAYAFTPEAVRRGIAEWSAILDRDRSHPSIVTWVPLNESWGVQHIAHDERMVAYAKALVHVTKTLDPSRPVISNDGWEHAESDILSIHDYDHHAERVRERYASRQGILGSVFTSAGRRLIVDASQGTDAPLMVTEFGGVSYTETDQGDAWGYSTATSSADLVERLRALVGAIRSSGAIAGYCYTQLADTGQETNGVLFEDRRPKAPLEEFRAIFGA